MKRTPLSLLVTFVFLVSSLLQAQVSIPTVPSSVGFAGINVQFDQDARAIIQADIKALLSNKKYWEAKLDRCLLFFPIVEGILIDENVPTDFKYLTVQESGLQPDAISASNAVGFWQFKKETGLEYGLRIDDQIDERKSINASTHAAAQYLKKSNAQYNNWVSSLYSYYLGAGGISKNIPAEWSYAKELKLNGKSDRYILRFFAHKIAIESAIDRYQSPNTTILLEYPQASGNNLKDIAAQFGIEPTLLRSQNRWLNGDEIPSDKDYTLVLPVDNQNLADAKAKLATIKRPNLRDNFAQKDIGFPVLRRAEGYGPNLLLYEINGLPGIMAGNDDTAESLAKKSRVSFSSFLRYNDMSERESIIPAQVYYLAKKNKRAVIPFHTVTEGESLWKVSQIYGIRLKNLIKYNRIDNRNQRLQPGRVLWLTKKRPKNKPVEVIEVPQDEWKPGSNKSQPTMAEAPTTPPPATSGNKIPQNPSERRTYTPKMADTPADGVEIETPPAAANTKKTPQPSNTTPNTKPNRRAPTFNPSDDRVVIINDDDEVPSKPATTKTPASTATNTPKNPTTTKSNTPPAQPKTEAATTTAGKAVLHTVEAGQTFYSISKMYDVSINDILYWNNLPQDATLKSGQKLTIRPVGNTPTQQQPKAEEFVSHIVVQGETMFSISKKYNVTLDQIKEWNGLPDYGVKIGQQLKIKKQ